MNLQLQRIYFAFQSSDFLVLIFFQDYLLKPSMLLFESFNRLKMSCLLFFFVSLFLVKLLSKRVYVRFHQLQQLIFA